MKKYFAIMFFIAMISSVAGLPQFSTEFYGTAIYYNDNVTTGQTINAYFNNNTLCGTFTVSNTGYYGLLTCLADDPETVAVEGANNTFNITFRINGIDTHTVGNNQFSSGDFKLVNISAPPLQCGDGFCDALFEGCGVCTEDCGVCPSTNTTGNATGNETGGGGNETGDTTGGSGTGGTGGSGGTGGAGGGQTTTGTVVTGGDPPIGAGEFCNENWECTEWSECSILNIQTRDCYDLNGCGSTENRPEEEQVCNFLAHCSDGIKNFDETGIDCGGSCGECDQCFNGIKDPNEDGVDCGGPCTACPSCFDGKMNQDEEGVDCGGSCEAICPEVVQRPGYVCTKSLSPFNEWFLLIITSVIISDIIVYFAYHMRVKKIKLSKKKDQFKKAAKIYRIKLRVFYYIISTFIISTLLLLYYWFFGICEELNKEYLWVLTILLVLSYFIINYLIKLFEFNEKKKLSIMQLLENEHYKRLEKIIAFHKKKLNDLMEEINRLIIFLMKDKEFLYVLETEKEFKIVYKDLVGIYLNKAKSDAFSQQEEKKDLEEIKKITEEENFKKKMKEHPKFDALVRRIELLIEQYDDLSKAEQEKQELEKKSEEETDKEIKKGDDDAKEENETKEK